MTRRGSLSWKPRLSAGGANRTNLNGVMRRFTHRNQRPQSEEDSLLRLCNPASGQQEELMPKKRQTNSFLPVTSRLHPSHSRYQPSWQIPCSPPQYRDEEPPKQRRQKLVPRRGMFQNAKYSELQPPPLLDEDEIRRTEGKITRLVERSHRKGYHDPPNYLLRDNIRQAVYRAGIPENYRARPCYEEYEEPSSSSSRRRHHRYSRKEREHRRKRVYEEDEDDFDMEDEEEEEEPSPPRKKAKRKKKRVVEEYEDDDEDEEEEEREIRRREKHHKKNKKRQREIDSSAEEDLMLLNRSNQSKASKTSKKRKETPPKVDEERVSSRASTRPPSPVSGPYIKDPDPDDNWRKSEPFMNLPNGAGAAMIARIGSAIQPIPLRDDTKNSYSDVAMMLLGKSLKNLNKPRQERDNEMNLHSQLMNMSTNWAVDGKGGEGNHNSHRNSQMYRLSDDDDCPDTRASILRDVSRIQHPDNHLMSTFQFDSMFEVSPQVEKNGRKNPMPPPMHRSSPISDDVFRTETMTAPSSIPHVMPKGPEDYGICISDDDDDDAKQFDIDDYIARGASQISYFPGDPDISFYVPQHNNPFEPTPSTSNVLETTKDDTMDGFNSRFMFSPRGKMAPMMDDTMGLFDSPKRKKRGREEGKGDHYLF